MLLPLLALPAVLGAPPFDRRRELGLIVPAYVYPAGNGLRDWERLISVAPKTKLILVFDPASGPGKSPDPNYASIVQHGRQAGARMIGYVTSSYAKKPLAEVEAEVDRYSSFYPGTCGIHVDEQSSGADTVPYYKALSAYIRRKIKNAVIVSNPGTICAEEFVSNNTADVFTIREGAGFPDSLSLPAWLAKYPAARFSVIAYGVADVPSMKAGISQLRNKNIGWTYVTDDTLQNPYDTLPPYWDAEVAAVK